MRSSPLHHLPRRQSAIAKCGPARGQEGASGPHKSIHSNPSLPARLWRGLHTRGAWEGSAAADIPSAADRSDVPRVRTPALRHKGRTLTLSVPTREIGERLNLGSWRARINKFSFPRKQDSRSWATGRPPTPAKRLPTGTRAPVYSPVEVRGRRSAVSTPAETGGAGCSPPRTTAGSATARCRRRRRSRAGEDSLERGVIGGEIGGGIVQRDGPFFQEGFRLPVIQCQHRPHLPLREASGAIPLHGRVLQDMTADRVRGLRPLTSDLIGHFHGDLHAAMNPAHPWHS